VADREEWIEENFRLRQENGKLRAALEAIIDRLKAVAEWNRFPSLEEAIKIANRELEK
jgi:hypothetical protein